MATLQTIRSRAGLLIAIIIGVALLGFILNDLFKSGGFLFKDSQYEIARISGKPIELQEYQQRTDELLENTKRNTGKDNLDEATVEMVRDQAWEALVRDYVMADEYDELGIGVSSDELFDMVQGNNIHPQIQQIPIFQNQQTGQFDRSLVIQFLKNMDQDETGVARSSWLAFEQALKQEQMTTKFNTLIKKGLYVTKFQAEQENIEKNKKVNFKYVWMGFKDVSDSSISITDEDIKKYYEENKYKFEQEASRDVEYVAFDIVPSQEDFKASEEWINNIKNDFVAAEDPIQFVNLNSDASYTDKYFKQGELEPAIDTVVFNVAEGTTVGPYFDGTSFKIAKLLKVVNMPDTVKASHILIKPDEKTGDIKKARAIVDSLKTLVEKGVKFEDLAAKFGTDATKDKGGDLGWFKREDMVAPFNDSCFLAKKGDLKIAITQFGVHLIKVVDRGTEVKKVKVAILTRNVEPSQRTFDNIYAKASEFAGKNNTKDKFEVAVREAGINKRLASYLKESDKSISGLDSPRELVRWAYKSEKGQVSNVFEFGSRYVVAVLTEVREKGYAPIEQIKTELENNVKREKKANQFAEKFNGKAGQNIDAIASALGLQIETAENISFNSYSLPAVGVEPNVIATAVETEKGKTSKPVTGNNGVFVVEVSDVVPAGTTDYVTETERLTSTYQSRVDYSVYEALKKASNIEDKRIKFY